MDEKNMEIDLNHVDKHYTDDKLDIVIDKLNQIKKKRKLNDLDKEKEEIFRSNIYRNFCQKNPGLKDKLSEYIVTIIDWLKERNYTKYPRDIFWDEDRWTECVNLELDDEHKKFGDFMKTTKYKIKLCQHTSDTSEDDVNLKILECLQEIGCTIMVWELKPHTHECDYTIHTKFDINKKIWGDECYYFAIKIEDC